MKNNVNKLLGIIVVITLVFMFIPVVSAASYTNSKTNLFKFGSVPSGYTHNAIEYEMYSSVKATTGSTTSFSLISQKATPHHYYYALAYYHKYEGIKYISRNTCRATWHLNIADMNKSVFFGTVYNEHTFPI